MIHSVASYGMQAHSSRIPEFTPRDRVNASVDYTVDYASVGRKSKVKGQASQGNSLISRSLILCRKDLNRRPQYRKMSR